MKPFSKAAAATVGAVIVLLVAAIVVHRHRAGSVPAATSAQPAIANAVKSRTPDAGPDWMALVRDTPADGRPTLMRRILSISDESLRNEAATALAANWMSGDLDEYLEFIDALVVEEGLASETLKRFSVALMRSFEQAAGKAPPDGKIAYVAEAIVNHLIAGDTARAETWAREFLVGRDHDNALAKIAPATAGRSPDDAVRIFGSIASISPRLTAASALGAALALNDPAAAKSWANSLSGHTERSLAMSGVATDPASAAAAMKAFLLKIQDDYTRQRERGRQTAGVKAEDEFETEQLYQEYLETNGHVLTQPDTPEADHLIDASERIAYELAKTDPQAALAWARSLAVGIVRAHPINGALAGWSEDFPREAVDYYVRSFGYDPLIPRDLFENWAATDPVAAVAAIGNLPEAGQRTYAIEGATRGWLASEREHGGLIGWVGQLPAGKDRDAAKLAIIEATGDADPAAAWRLVTGIANESSRRRAAKDVFPLLAVEDPPTARAALENYQAPAEDLEALGRILTMAEAN